MSAGGQAPRDLLSVRPPQTRSQHLADGTRLDATIWRPEGPGRHPVLLMRQPYGRAIASSVVLAHPAWYAAHGYVVAIQDVRGAGSSEGQFHAYASEAADGAEAVAWAASLEGTTGEVGMYGFSYQGATQWLAAGERPPALKAICPAMSLWDTHAEAAAPGGAFGLAGAALWACQMAALAARREGDAAAYAELAAAGGGGLRFDGPMPAAPAILERHARLTHYADWRDRPAQDPYWSRVAPARRVRPEGFAIPALHIGGWFDDHLPGTLAGHAALAGRAAAPQPLLVGPWTHLAWAPRQAGQDYGPEAASDIDALQVAWFDHWLKGRGERPPIGGLRLFDLGRRAWREMAAWPAAAAPLTFHLGGTGRAAARLGDGVLGRNPPPAPSAEWFVHDPWRPVPACAPPAERTGIDQRADVAVFTSAPLETQLTLLGAPRLWLGVDSEAPSFDIAASLSVVGPDGRATALSNGYRHVPPGEAWAGEAEVALQAVCITLMPGQRLRLSVAGACFPAFPVNPGTGADPRHATAAEAVPIPLAIRCGGAAGSVLHLPVPGED